MSNPKKLKTGDVVKYARPDGDEEAALRFIVKEVHEDRAHIELIDSELPIRPVEVVPIAEIELAPLTVEEGVCVSDEEMEEELAALVEAAENNPEVGYAFTEGEFIRTFGGRPETTIYRVDEEARKIVDGLKPGFVMYATHAGRGEFRGFAALHDLLDANMLMPGAEIYFGGKALSPYTDFCNATMNEVTRLLLAHPLAGLGAGEVEGD